MNTMTKEKTALLITEPWGQSDEGLEMATDMVPVCGKHVLHRVMDGLAEMGYKKIHVVLGEHAPDKRQFLHNGARWGCEITYHNLNPHETISAMIRGLKLTEEVMLADSHVLIQNENFGIEAAQHGCAAVICKNEGWLWTGWANVKAEWLAEQDEAFSHQGLSNCLLQDEAITKCEYAVVANAADMNSLLETSAKLVSGVVVENGAYVHPSAQIHAPVFIGRNVRISKDAVIGPNAVIGECSYIESKAIVSNSLVLPATHIANSLEVNTAIVCGQMLYHGGLDTAVEMRDGVLLSAIPDVIPAKKIKDINERVLALVLMITLSPLYIWLNLVRSNTRWMARGQKIQTHFTNRFYPGLIAMLKGELKLHGPERLAKSEDEMHPPAWQRVFKGKRCGLLQESVVVSATNAELDKSIRFASDLYAAECQDWQAGLGLLARYLRALAKELISRGHCGEKNAADLGYRKV